MKSNLIVLKTQECQEEFYTHVEPTLTKRFAQCGVDIQKTILFKHYEDLDKSIFGLLETCSILLIDLSNPHIESLFSQISKFYACEKIKFEQGFLWHDENTNRYCVLFDLYNTDFLLELDYNFLRKLFAPTKFLTIIKTYGLDESEVRRVMNLIPNNYDFEFYITSNFLDCEIDILAEGDYYKSKELTEYIRLIYENLGEYIYSDNDDSLFDKLSELLEIRRVKIAFCDALTSGLFKNMLKECINGYSSKVCMFHTIAATSDYTEILKVNPKLLAKYDVNSVEVIYETASSMLENTMADIVVVLSGTFEKPYIAIGDNTAIHLYKFSFNHTHSLISNIMIQTAIFKLIKKLKKNYGLF